MKNECPRCKEKFGLKPLPSRKYGPDEEWPAGRGVLPMCPKCGVALLVNTHKYESYVMYTFVCLILITIVAMWFIKALWVVWVSVVLSILVLLGWAWAKRILLTEWERWVVADSNSSNNSVN